MAVKPTIIVVATQISSATNGGIESLTQFLINMNDYDAVVITNVDNDRTRQWRAAGIPIHIVSMAAPPRRRLARLVYWGLVSAGLCRMLSRLMRYHGTRLVLANDPLAMQLVYPYARLGWTRTALCLRGVPDFVSAPPSNRKYRALFAASRHLFFLSKDMCDTWLTVAPAKAKTSITYVAVPDAFFEASWRPDPARPKILICGRLSNIKGQLEFLQNCAKPVIEAGIDVVFAGDDHNEEREYAHACRRAAVGLGSGVEMLGHRSDPLHLYSTATALVMPSRIEGLGRARAEAMAVGCPVISFDVCSSQELLAGGAGIIVPQGDWEAMTKAIIETLADPARLDALSSNGRRRAQELFTSKQVVNCYELGLDQMREG